MLSIPFVAALALSCSGSEGPTLDVHGFAKTCMSLHSGGQALVAEGDGYVFSRSGDAVAFTMQPSDLGTYLLYDAGGFVVAEDGPLLRETELESDVTRVDDTYISGAEWSLETSERDGSQYQLRSRRTDLLMGKDGLDDRGVAISFEEASGCQDFPELALDAEGEIIQTTWDDGDLYGIVDTHSHILSNFGFGGGVFHGGAFHRLGVEHALGDCAVHHGEMGRKDVFGYVYDNTGNNTGGLLQLVTDLGNGELSDDNHVTDGYPEFTEWPNARERATHQTQYYRWLERAWMGGLRLVVQHATTNSVICTMTVQEGLQPSLYDCEDMTAVDRIIDETWAMQDYIDAQSGGPGTGFFRIVESPAEARAAIEDGKMAVVLGIETSDLFDCHLTPREGGPICDEAYVEEQLDIYYDRGVRVMFPVHKYDNRFSPGDGSSGFIELGNFMNSGHWTNMTQDCPGDGMPPGFDHGAISFGDLNVPRDEYLSEAPEDVSDFLTDPLETALGYASEFLSDPIDGEWCQNATITPVGEALLDGMMARGMIIEVDHFPQWSYQRAFEILEENDYPAAGTHGRNWNGRLFALGGVSMIGLGRCQDVDNPGSTLTPLLDEIALTVQEGAYPAAGFGFDLNGFAGAPRPRFGDDGCSNEQPNPMSYPFVSYAGDVEFSEPTLGERMVDFDTEGMIHIGLLPELIQDARTDALSDSDLEGLFRSAEGYVRMWEKAEARGLALSGG